MRRMQAGGELDAIRLRRFVVEALGNAVHALAQRMSAPTDPLVVIGHSLGCHMISNYIWDVQKHGPEYPFVKNKTSAFELFRTLTAIDTFGCNIPLFLLARDTLSPINFPIDLSTVFPDPLSHTAYWTDGDVVQPIAKNLIEIARLL